MLAITVGVFAVCRPDIGVHASDVPGVYELGFGSGKDRFTLRKDGTYLEEVILEDSREPVQHSGHWTYTDRRVHIVDCLSVFDDDGGARTDFVNPIVALCDWPVERTWYFVGKLRLAAYDGDPYEKVD